MKPEDTQPLDSQQNNDSESANSTSVTPVEQHDSQPVSEGAQSETNTSNQTSNAIQPAGVGSKPKKGLSKMFVGIAAAIVLLAGGSASAYYGVVVPNRPENKVKNAFYSMIDSDKMKMSADVSLKSDGQIYDFNLSMTSDMVEQAAEMELQFDVQGTTTTVQARMLNDKVYINMVDLGALGDIAESLIGLDDLSIIEDQWIALESSDVLGDSNGCQIDALTIGDKDRQAIKNAYDEFPLFTVEQAGESTVGGNTLPRYKLIPVSDEEAENFLNQVTDNAPFVQALEECGGETLDTTDIEDNTSEATGEIYVVVDKGEVRQVEMTVNDDDMDMTLVLDFNFDTDIQITAPENTKTFEEMMSLLMTQSYSQSYGIDDYSFDLEDPTYVEPDYDTLLQELSGGLL